MDYVLSLRLAGSLWVRGFDGRFVDTLPFLPPRAACTGWCCDAEPSDRPSQANRRASMSTQKPCDALQELPAVEQHACKTLPYMSAHVSPTNMPAVVYDAMYGSGTHCPGAQHMTLLWCCCAVVPNTSPGAAELVLLHKLAKRAAAI